MNNIALDKKLMFKALKEAKRGIPYVYPNPAVGCVIYDGSKILSTGYHKKFGEIHAEHEAIKNLDEMVKGLTMYVSLEPCTHTGKTGACLDLIDPEVFERVVIAEKDPNSEASGSIEKLKKRGIKVDLGLLKHEARKLNKRFYVFHEKKRPYVILKYASTLDGFIAQENGYSKWITNEKSRKENHYTRSICDAILIGSNTARIDNPDLGSHGCGRDPKIVLIDFDNALGSLDLFKKKPIVYSSIELSNDAGKNINFIMNDLYKKNIQSLLVEGGAKTISNFLNFEIFDELHCYVAPKFLGKGLNIFQGENSIEKNYNLELVDTKMIGDDLKIVYKKSYT